MKNIYLIVAKGSDNQFDISDPAGARYGLGESLVKDYLPIEILENNNGILKVRYGNSIREGVVEGTTYGTYCQLETNTEGIVEENPLTRNQKRQLFVRLNALKSDPTIGSRVTDVLKLFDKDLRKQLFLDSVTVLEDPQAKASDKTWALDMIKSILMILE